MKWTDKIPKKDGWYWCLQPDLLNATPEVVKVKVIKWEDKQEPEVWFIDQGTMKKHVIKQYDPLLWYGPLKVPAWRSIMKIQIRLKAPVPSIFFWNFIRPFAERRIVVGNTVINQLELADPNKYYIHVNGKFIEVAGEKVDLFPHAGDFFMHRSHDGWEGRRWKVSEGITGGSICAAEPKKNVKAAAMRKLKTRLHGGETIDHRIESLIDGDYKNVSPRYRRKET